MVINFDYIWLNLAKPNWSMLFKLHLEKLGLNWLNLAKVGYLG
jgi:hypothetical protein